VKGTALFFICSLALVKHLVYFSLIRNLAEGAVHRVGDN
jgi:hypothetical protein